MARPSKLTDPMRAEISKRMAAGEGTRALAREYKIPESTLRKNFSAQAPIIKNVATALATAELDMSALPVYAQRAVRSLTDQLKDIQNDYAAAAARSAKTAKKFADLAGVIADAIPEDAVGTEAVSGCMVVGELTKTMNAALAPASNLIAANKQAGQADKPTTLIVETGVPRE